MCAMGVESKGRTETGEHQLVVFKLGEEAYGLSISEVQEINRIQEITRLPGTPEFVEGVINLRGRIIPVIDLRKRFGFEAREWDRSTRIVVTRFQEETIGVIVDSVTEVLRISEEVIEPPSKVVEGVETEYIQGIANLGEKLVILLDLNKAIKKDEADFIRGLDER